MSLGPPLQARLLTCCRHFAHALASSWWRLPEQGASFAS